MKLIHGLMTATLVVTLSVPAAWAQAVPTTTAPVAPLQLKPTSNAPITLHMVDDSKAIYQAIGKSVGIDVLFDSDYVGKHVAVDLTNVSLSDALRIVGDISGTFYKPLTANSIFVAQNNRQKHNELDDMEVHTFYLTNVSQQAEANEIVTGLRNTLSIDDKIYIVPNQNAIVVRATPDDIALAQKLIHDLDHPKKNYRLTYTVTEMDGGKQIGTQHYAMILVSGQTTTLKQGSRVPLVTGSYSAVATDKTPAGAQTQVTYIDIGMNFDATLTATGDGAMLRSSVEQSSVAPETSGVGPQDPIVRQTSLRGESFLAPGKSVALGSLDIPGSTSHLQIEVVMDPLP
jgi:type II secretory pathway component GspD/PulD (secretin)